MSASLYKKFRSISKTFYSIIVIVLFVNSFINSQTRVDSLEYLRSVIKVNFLGTQFDKQLNTYYLNSRFQIISDNDIFYIRLNENFNSTFIRNENKSTRDEQYLVITTKYNFNRDFALGLSANSSLLSDNRSLGINESSVNYATLFTEFVPMHRLIFSPFGGYESNQQIGITDNGFVYGIEGLLDKITLADADVVSELRLRNEDILPRRNLIRYYFLSVTNNFDRNVLNNIRTAFSESRKDFYFQADSVTQQQFNVENNIQSRSETVYFIQDRLSYDKFFDIFTLELSGGINWRSIDRDIRYKPAESSNKSLYDTQIDELKLEVDAITKYNSKSFNAAFRINYYERDEKHIAKRYEEMSEIDYIQNSENENQKNNISNRATLSLFGGFKISESDLLSFSLYHSKLKYDTPSLLNNDDRDELLSIARLGYIKKISPYFSAFVNAEGTYGHTVYLFASRSSNNNENRIIRLRAGGDYYGTYLKSYNSFEVSANYTVYDYEDITSNYQSYSFRQFTAIDSTTIPLLDRVSLFNYAYIKLSEIGDFRWENFTSRPTRYLSEIYLEPRFILTLTNSLFSAGLRMFSLDTYGYLKSSKTLENEYFSIGPVVLIQAEIWRRFSLLLRGYYEFISSTNVPDKQQVSLLLQMNWNF